MLNTILLQSGAMRRAAWGHRSELLDALSSGWFWGILIFAGICVAIYHIVKKGNKK